MGLGIVKSTSCDIAGRIARRGVKGGRTAEEEVYGRREIEKETTGRPVLRMRRVVVVVVKEFGSQWVEREDGSPVTSAWC